MTGPKPAERMMLELIAYHDPIDCGQLRNFVGERLNGEFDNERYRTARENLKELDLIVQPGVGHEYLHITEEGWSHLGGETPRYEGDTDFVNAPHCPICDTDEMVEASW